jgi:hypothetical protein
VKKVYILLLTINIMNIMDLLKRAREESERETSEFLQEETRENISNILAKQRQRRFSYE